MRRPVSVKTFLSSFLFLLHLFLLFPNCSRSAKPLLSPPFHPHSLLSDCRSVQVGCTRFSFDRFPERGAIILESKKFRHLLLEKKPSTYRIIYAVDRRNGVVNVLHIGTVREQQSPERKKDSCSSPPIQRLL